MAKAGNVFFRHADNRQYVKSRAGKPKLGPNIFGVMIPFFIGMMLVSVIGLVIFSVILPYYATLAQSRAPIEAVVTDMRIEKDADLANEYWIDYEYTVGGVSYTGNDMVGRADYNTNDVGMPIEVTYSPADPSISMIEYEPLAVLGLLAVTLLFFAIGLCGTILSFFSQQDRGQLIRNGKIVKATIEDTRQSTDSDGDASLAVTYTFRSPLTGKDLRKRESVLLSRGEASGEARIGTTVAVLYLKDDLYRLL